MEQLVREVVLLSGLVRLSPLDDLPVHSLHPVPGYQELRLAGHEGGPLAELARESTMRDLAEEYIAAGIAPIAISWGRL